MKLALLALAVALGLAGQATLTPRPKPAPKEEKLPDANIRVSSTLILVPVTVNDPLNRPVSGLERENFRVFEDKVEQPISTFAMDDEPVAVGLVFDTSGSMGDKLKRSRMAAREFFRLGGADDEYFLVEFDSKPRLQVGLTSDTGAIESQLLFSKSHGSTALLDAILLAIQEMRHSKKNKKALLIISDGGACWSSGSACSCSPRPAARSHPISSSCSRRARCRGSARRSCCPTASRFSAIASKARKRVVRSAPGLRPVRFRVRSDRPWGAG